MDECFRRRARRPEWSLVGAGIVTTKEKFAVFASGIAGILLGRFIAPYMSQTEAQSLVAILLVIALLLALGLFA